MKQMKRYYRMVVADIPNITIREGDNGSLEFDFTVCVFLNATLGKRHSALIKGAMMRTVKDRLDGILPTPRAQHRKRKRKP